MNDRWESARRDHRAHQAGAIATAALNLLLEEGAPGLTMAGIAVAAGVSRPTLYRYFSDVDAVLVGVAELLADHDEAVARAVAAEADPVARLDLVVRTVARADGHDRHAAAELRAALPPDARQVLSAHEERIRRLLTDVLAAGVDQGRFRADLVPATDAGLLLGLSAAADADSLERALDLVHRVVDPPQEETPP